ncbi:hypothetical protein [Streptomyces sp. YS-3]|uniref:hypothetical protein n=1 Tax=Streptomyces sp. YS-3 TaxID=3381352 RepID=UPI0038626076
MTIMTFSPARRAAAGTATAAMLALLAVFPATATADDHGRELVSPMLTGGTTAEQLNELGIPVSTVSGVSSIAAIHAKGGSETPR